MTFSEENYLKAIYGLQKENPSGVSTNAVAENLDTKAASATDMIKKLNEKQLVNYKPYQGVLLNAEGEKWALHVIRKHRLWETFLAEKLKFGWEEIHEVAEQLEHIHSEKLVRELDRFLGFPEYDPHGDPIPDEEGNLPKVAKRKLSQLNVGDQGVCTGVNDTSSSFLKFLAKQQINLGTNIEVLELESFDRSMSILINGEKVVLSKIATDNIYVKH